MPNQSQNRNISSVADMLTGYLNVALKRQDQFSAPLVRVTGEEGGVTLQRAHAGTVIREPKKAVNQYDRLYSVLGFAEGSDPTDVEDTYIKTTREGIDDLRQAGATITPEMGDAIFSNITKTFGFDKPTKAVDKEKLQNANIADENKIDKIKTESGGEIGFEPAKEAVKKKGFLGIDRLAKDIPAEEGFYWEMIGGEKVPISKKDYDKRLIAKNKEKRHIPIFEQRIEERNKILGTPKPKSREDLDPLGIR